MPDDTSTNLELLSRELLARLNSEDGKPAKTASTELVGGFAKAGSKLEGLLREVVVVAARLEDRRPEELLTTVGSKGGTKPSLRKAMAGPMAWGLRNYFAARAPSSIPAVLRPILADLVSEKSRIHDFIRVRNHVVKEDGDPAVARVQMSSLRELIIEFRRNAGWS